MHAPENPFPGMNPFLELRWSDAHTRLIGYISDALAEELPADLSIRAEERIAVGSLDRENRDRGYRADVAVRENWKDEFPPLWQPQGKGESAILVAEPEIVASVPPTERWLEIRDLDGRLVTALELLSPYNKSESGRDDYRRKQRDYILGRVSLVEIDLLRGGSHTVAVDPGELRPQPGIHSIICVTRVQDGIRHEVYRCPFRERLPAFRVPLRISDPDVPLDLQPLIDRCYRTGRYWQISDPARLFPALPEPEHRWVAERVAAG